MRGYFRTTKINPDKNLQAYVVGLAIGDGNLSNPNGRAVRLRITCDNKYPFLLQKIVDSVSLLFPENRVSLIKRKGCTDVSIYSNHLEKILGWRTGEGSKFFQHVSMPEWIERKKAYRISFLKGLIETDGSIYIDRGYPMVMFVTIIPELAKKVNDIIASLGFQPHLYRIERHTNKYKFNQQILYHVRISKNVSRFLNFIKPEKY